MLLIFLVLSGLMSANASAEFAVINLQKVITESSAAKKIREEVDAQKEQLQKLVKEQEETLREKEKKLVEKRSILSSEAFEDERNIFRKQLAEAQRNVQQNTQQIEQAFAKSMELITQKIESIVTDLAVENKYEMAFPSNQLIFYQDQLDITDVVVKRLDKDLPKVPFKLNE